MTTQKRKISISLDSDLVSELERDRNAISAQINDAVRSELDRRRRLRLLGEMLDEWSERDGPPDERLVGKYMDLLS